MRWEDGGVSSPSASAAPAAVVIRISPMAHFAVGFLALGVRALVFAGPAWVVPLLVIPVLLSASIVRYRTVADRDTVTARTLLGSETVSWDDIEGLRFGKGAWAYARRKDGSELRLPAAPLAPRPPLAPPRPTPLPSPST